MLVLVAIRRLNVDIVGDQPAATTRWLCETEQAALLQSLLAGGLLQGMRHWLRCRKVRLQRLLYAIYRLYRLIVHYAVLWLQKHKHLQLQLRISRHGFTKWTLLNTQHLSLRGHAIFLDNPTSRVSNCSIIRSPNRKYICMHLFMFLPMRYSHAVCVKTQLM